MAVRNIMTAVKVIRPLNEALNGLEDANAALPLLPSDVVDTICDMVRFNAAIQEALLKPVTVTWPFKVQHKNFWTRRPQYRICICTCNENVKEIGWTDF
jgi:hypothetical protein